jgi:hypothetical protein
MDDNNTDELLSLLPENYHYFVEKCDLTSQDNYRATIRVKSIASEEEFSVWLSDPQKTTRLEWKN